MATLRPALAAARAAALIDRAQFLDADRDVHLGTIPCQSDLDWHDRPCSRTATIHVDGAPVCNRCAAELIDTLAAPGF